MGPGEGAHSWELVCQVRSPANCPLTLICPEYLPWAGHSADPEDMPISCVLVVTEETDTGGDLAERGASQ